MVPTLASVESIDMKLVVVLEPAELVITRRSVSIANAPAVIARNMIQPFGHLWRQPRLHPTRWRGSQTFPVALRLSDDPPSRVQTAEAHEPRLKRCADGTCGWAFWDVSRDNSRRWCNMRVCGNHRAYIARQREARANAG